MRQVRPDDPMTADLSSLLADLKTKADKAEWRGGELPHGEHPCDYGYGYVEVPPQVVAALAEVAEAAGAYMALLDLEGMADDGDLDAALARLRLALAGKENSDETR